MKSGEFLDNIQIDDFDLNSFGYGGNGGSNLNIIECPASQRMSGLIGTYGDYIN